MIVSEDWNIDIRKVIVNNIFKAQKHLADLIEVIWAGDMESTNDLMTNIENLIHEIVFDQTRLYIDFATEIRDVKEKG